MSLPWLCRRASLRATAVYKGLQHDGNPFHFLWAHIRCKNQVSWPRSWNLCFVLEKSPVQISVWAQYAMNVTVPYFFSPPPPPAPQANVRTAPQIRPRPFLSTSFPFHYLPVSLSLDAIQPDAMKASINKL